jgi:hypothetical protein
VTFSEWDSLHLLEDAFSAPREDDDDLPARPTTRGACMDAPRPCPYVTCKHHLLLDVSADGSILLNDGDQRVGSRAFSPRCGDDLDERAINRLQTMPATCALDVADEGGHSDDEVGAHLGVTPRHVRRLVERGFERARDDKELQASYAKGRSK